MTYATTQENLWVGSFGDEYVDRNERAALLAPKLMLLARIIERTHGIRSILEFGANIGLNQIALKSIIPSAKQIAIEINEKAFRRLERIEGVEAHLGSILSFNSGIVADLSFTSALLIHINPNELQRAYDILYQSARRYIAMIEYYNHEPIEVMYKGNTGCLFKRDWAGDMLTRFPDLRLVDYGFVYRRDPNFSIDDVHWFLLEKMGTRCA
jgi:pseudaminic acid biosynthesis-associated methylase